jgi:hypothetical protein
MHCKMGVYVKLVAPTASSMCEIAIDMRVKSYCLCSYIPS